ncbi:hypothetical protein [Pseudomonas sp. TWI628]|uniref:hypothetical protein n=1 Tax=Pseudomonas sp. TWI628 TaxID=3136788 RepID=UPI003208F5FE
MARKQEKPESTVEPKGPVSSTEISGSQLEDRALTLPPSGTASPNLDEPVASATVPGSTESAELALPEAPVGTGTGSGFSAGDLGTNTEALAKGAVWSEGAGQNAPELPGNTDETVQSVGEDPGAANPNPATLQIYPMRSYMDEGELRRRGGPAYSVPRRHAEELVERKLASLEPLRE